MNVREKHIEATQTTIVKTVEIVNSKIHRWESGWKYLRIVVCSLRL